MVLTALSLSTDSLVVAVALAQLFTSIPSRMVLVLLFGVCDGTAVIVGAELGWRLGVSLSSQVVVLLLAFYGFYVLAVARWRWRAVSRGPAWLLPFMMSLDNLAYGVETHGGKALADQAVVLGLSSSLMTAIGLAMGTFAFKPAGRSREQATGVLLIAASAALLLT
jgi:putative Mn2+ efflux pump MntP